jgi:hypothetical protein
MQARLAHTAEAVPQGGLDQGMQERKPLSIRFSQLLDEFRFK